jgi:hypothetical protein
MAQSQLLQKGQLAVFVTEELDVFNLIIGTIKLEQERNACYLLNV